MKTLFICKGSIEVGDHKRKDVETTKKSDQGIGGETKLLIKKAC